MDTPTPFSGREPLTRLRLACVALVGGLAAAGAALAAPCAQDGCRNVAREPAGPQVAPRDLLRARHVDLAAAAAQDAGVRASDSVAPLLYLTPRVASILEEVFGDAAGAAGGEPEPAPEAQPPAAAPLVGTTSPEEPERYGPLSQAENNGQLPKFQRQMYRTDI